MNSLTQLKFNNTYARLPAVFYRRVNPVPLQRTHLVSVNASAAQLIALNIAELNHPQKLNYFCGSDLLPGMDPIAQCYAGHQFGHFVPQLGDGRAILLGEVVTESGDKWDLQLKGSGLTPYSRGGDGRAVLRSTIREYLCSEAMQGLGIPTTRALCILGSEEAVYRERVEPGAMLLRMAPSHVRFGTFEYFYYADQHEQVTCLADYVIDHLYPWLNDSIDNKYYALLEIISQRTARLIAQWQAVGFSHGVMNSDNMSILGLTLDYGPFGFLDAYNPEYICNHSDHQGRYAFNQQPQIGLFNISCLAQAMLPLFTVNGANDAKASQAAVAIAQQAFTHYETTYAQTYAKLMRQKLGLTTQQDGDQTLVESLLELMAQDQVDYTIFFRRLSDFSIQPSTTHHHIRDLFIQRDAFNQWAERYRVRLAQEDSDDVTRVQQMKAVNPKYILRNYLAETAIRQAENDQDYTEIDRLLSLLQHPFDEQPEQASYADFPPDWAQQLSVSCSS